MWKLRREEARAAPGCCPFIIRNWCPLPVGASASISLEILVSNPVQESGWCSQRKPPALPDTPPFRKPGVRRAGASRSAQSTPRTTSSSALQGRGGRDRGLPAEKEQSLLPALCGVPEPSPRGSSGPAAREGAGTLPRPEPVPTVTQTQARPRPRQLPRGDGRVFPRPREPRTDVLWAPPACSGLAAGSWGLHAAPGLQRPGCAQVGRGARGRESEAGREPGPRRRPTPRP